MCGLAAGFKNVKTLSGISGWRCTGAGASAKPEQHICLHWTGVTCSSSVVTSIRLAHKGIVGFISADIGIEVKIIYLLQ